MLGHTLAYRVTDIRVIDPDDFSVFGIEAGKDEVSLLTCTPYGVTRAKPVTGERGPSPITGADLGARLCLRRRAAGHLLFVQEHASLEEAYMTLPAVPPGWRPRLRRRMCRGAVQGG